MNTGYRPEMIQRAFVVFIGSHLNSFWSLTTPKLRLIARQVLSNDLVALQFETNRAFRRQTFGMTDSWHGGQHIGLSVFIDGIYHQRTYSLVGLPQQPEHLHKAIFNRSKNNNSNTLTIAIKPQGLVSNYLTRHAPLGVIVDSSLPNGEFTLGYATSKMQTTGLPSAGQSPLLCIAGGSGITPMLGLITEALAQKRDVTLLYYNRTSLTKTPFYTYWQYLTTTYPNFTYHLINTNDPSSYLAGRRHLSAQSLLALPLVLAETTIFACGSTALLAGLYRATEALANKDLLSQGRSLQDNMVIERFGIALPDPNSNKENTDDSTEAHTVYLRGRQRQFNSNTTLLLDAEQAGIGLTYGCRQGICQLCRCQKVSGVVKNIQTGNISSDGFESIQTCINMALTDVILDV